MSLSNLATVFGPTLMRPPVASLDQYAPPVDISQEVEVQVSLLPFRVSKCEISNAKRIEAGSVLQRYWSPCVCVFLQVHVIYRYLQIPNLPEALTTKPLDTEEDP